SDSSASTVETAAADSSEVSNSATGSYKVKTGDTLSGIAAKHDVSVATLQNTNRLNGDDIVAGQSLQLSGSSDAAADSSSDNTTSSEPAQASSYTVKSGDTLSGIAARNGLSLNELLAANGMQSSSEIIQAGQTLNLSGSSSASTASGSDEQLVGDTFMGRTYPDEVVANANDHQQALLDAPMPSRTEVREMLQATASLMRVDVRVTLAHAQTKSVPTLTIISKHCLMHRCLLEPRFVKWSKPRQAPWGLILVWHWHMLRLSPVSTLQPFLLQTRSDRCRLSRHQVSGLLSL